MEETLPVSHQIRMSEKMDKAITDYQIEMANELRNVPSKSEAIRSLLELGLKHLTTGE